VVEGHRAVDEAGAAMRHIGVWPERDAMGDASWRDGQSGELVTRSLVIPLDKLRETSRQILGEFGQSVRRLLAGLLMPDWPQGARRAINFSLAPVADLSGASRSSNDRVLDTFREADAFGFEFEGD
jgi:hypothetical protein